MSTVFATTYKSPWERLASAVDRVVTSTRVSRDGAMTDISRAIADGEVDFRAKLGSSEVGGQRAAHMEPLNRQDLHVPAELLPEDFDWELSRPRKAWGVKDVDRIRHRWFLDWLELRIADVTHALCGGSQAAPDPVRRTGKAAGEHKTSRSSRTQPEQERARLAMDEIFQGAPPPQHLLPNARLHDLVLKRLEKKGLRPVSLSTTLRAAGRRKDGK